MKTFLTTICLIFSAFLLFSSQTGFAYQTLEDGCLTCHTEDQLHTKHDSQSCTLCHPGSPGAKPIASSTCIACHPRTGNKGLCPLINNVASHPKSTCLGCHATDCPAPVTTTTTAAATTTTTTPVATTTTTVPVVTTTTVPVVTTTTVLSTTTTTGLCPAEAVLGADDPRLDTLREFRDQVLAKNKKGQNIIELYYNSSDAVVEMLEKNPELKEAAKEYLETILPTIEQMIKQRANKK